MFEHRRFPQYENAPTQLLEMDGHCGLLAAWSVLHFFGKSFSIPELVKACRHTKRHGIFTVTLGAALKVHGLQVSFHTDPDKDIGGFEKRCYASARKIGLSINPALGLAELLRERRRGRVPIVLFNTDSNFGHFSPLLGIQNAKLSLPLADDKVMDVDDFLGRWSAHGINRQCVIAGLPEA